MAVSDSFLSPEGLMLRFLSNVSDYDVKFIEGLNPFTIKVDGEIAYIYIKNLSPAQLSNRNEDVWRVQLPIRDEFTAIKASESLFLMLGYDSVNKVFTTWNPYWCKQRLNVGKSVSLYSRWSLQQNVGSTGIITTMLLNHESTVVCIPENQIYDFIKHVKDYFPEDTVFVAKGSSIVKKLTDRGEALFAKFCDFGDGSDFVNYLLNEHKLKESAIKSCLRNLVIIRDIGLLDDYKELFVHCTSYEEYLDALDIFFHNEEIAILNQKSHRWYRAALYHYVRYFFAVQQASSENEGMNMPHYDLDEYGKLKSLDCVISEKLRPLAVCEYPDYETMLQISQDYYPSSIVEKMTLVDWMSLFEKTKWKKIQKRTF